MILFSHILTTLACLGYVALLAISPMVAGNTIPWNMDVFVMLGTVSLALTLLSVVFRPQPYRYNWLWLGAVLLFVLWVYASIFWAGYTYEAWRSAHIWLVVLGAAFSGHVLSQNKGWIWVFLATICLTGLAAVYIAHYQLSHSLPEWMKSGYDHTTGSGYNITGPYFNPSHFSGYLVAVAGVCMSMVLFTRFHVHTLILLGIVVAVHWANVRTDASSIPAVILATVLPFVVWIWAKNWKVGLGLTLLGSGLVVWLGLMFLSPGGQQLFEQYKTKIGLHNTWDRFLLLRKAVWIYGLQATQERPIQGIGIGQFYIDSHKYRGIPKNSPMHQGFVNYAHNDFLQIRSELGIVGLLLFLGVIVFSFIPFNQNKLSVYRLGVFGGYLFTSWYESHVTYIPSSMVIFYSLLGFCIFSKARKDKT